MKNPFQRLTQSGNDEFITVVSGLPRSGTSMMMKMLAAGGIPPLTDALRAADRDNPKGYYEFERVKQLDKGDTAWLPLAQGKVVKVISFLLQYLPPDQTYQVVFLRRNIDEILASQRKMLIHRGEDPDQMDDAQVAAMLSASWNSPSATAPSPKKHTATRPLPSSWAASAAPVAIGSPPPTMPFAPSMPIEKSAMCIEPPLPLQ